MGIVRFALRFPHTFYVVAALIVFLGVIAIRTMPADIFPEINIPVVTVRRPGQITASTFYPEIASSRVGRGNRRFSYSSGSPNHRTARPGVTRLS